MTVPTYANSLPPLRNVIRRDELLARKSLGQHFLLDANITEKIVRISGDLKDCAVIEIGPGPGGLTRPLLASGALHVHAVEKDTRFLNALEELSRFYPGRLSVVSEDALKVACPQLAPAPRAIVANLPYNVATPLLLRWLDDIAQDPQAYKSLTLMFQKEVAERLYALPSTKAYGRLSILTQWLCQVEHAFDLPASAFTPPPKVDSSVVKLTPRSAPLARADKKTLEAVLAAAFGQRRKMLRSSLQSFSPDAIMALQKSGIDPTRRAETLSVEEFCRLTESIAKE